MNGQHRSVASYFITLAFVGRLYLVDSARLATSPEGSASGIELAGQMEEVFELDKTDAEKITPEAWENSERYLEDPRGGARAAQALPLTSTDPCPYSPECAEDASVLKNPLGARFRPRSATKNTLFGRFEADLWCYQLNADFFNKLGRFREGPLRGSSHAWGSPSDRMPLRKKDVGQGDPGRPDHDRPDPSEDDRGESGHQVGTPTR